MFKDRPRTSFSKPHRHLQRCKSSYDKGHLAKEVAELNKARVNIEFLSKTEKSAFHREVHRRVDGMMENRQKQLELRRAKLKGLLDDEEEDLEEEALIERRHRQDEKLEEMQRRKDELAELQEEENRKTVEQKRIQQSMGSCPELRPHLFRRNLLDSKEAQLQQIRENQERKRNAKELSSMWDDVTTRDVQAKLIGDRNDAIENRRRQRNQREDLDVQIREKELLKLDVQRTKLENQLKIDGFDSVLKQKEAERVKNELNKRNRYVGELTQQMRTKEKLLAESAEAQRRANEEVARVLSLEREEEMTRAKETSAAAKQEAAQYVNGLNELLKQRREEERRLEELLEDHGEKIALRERENARKIRDARSKLHEDVLEGRQVQLEQRKQVALAQRQQKQNENEEMKLAGEEHRRQEEEGARRRAAAAKKYRCELQKQIEENNSLREEERQKSLRGLELEKLEEEKLRKLARDAIAEKCVRTTGHPFRKILAPEDERYPSVNPIF